MSKTNTNQPSPKNILSWFNPIGKQTGGLAFILNRVTAIGLTLYLYVHLIVLGQLANGPEAYDGFVSLMNHPIIIFGELLIVAAGIMHGLNGVRIILTTFGIGVTHQKLQFYILMGIALIVILIFAVRMFNA